MFQLPHSLLGESEHGWVHTDYGVIKRVTNEARRWQMRQDGDKWGRDGDERGPGGDEWGLVVMNAVVMNEGQVVTNECRWHPPLSHHLTSRTVHINWCACHFCEVTERWRIMNPWVGCRFIAYNQRKSFDILIWELTVAWAAISHNQPGL